MSRSPIAKLDTDMASARAGWVGFDVTEYDIDRLRRARKVPLEAIVRVSSGEMVLAPKAGERVVFTSHFARGFALPVSKFFRDFLDHFGMQPHHLGANGIMLLSACVTLCEAYLGVRPTVGLWVWLYHFKSHMIATGRMLDDQKGPGIVPEKVMTACGTATIYANSSTSFLSPKPMQSVKKW